MDQIAFREKTLVIGMNLTTLPTFFILGAAKAGTTTLYDVLKQHPQVYMPFTKEPLFFSNDKYFKKGVGWYTQTFFSGAEAFPARGEATPHYLYWSHKVAPRIYSTQAQAAKLIVIFRDPVQRAYSGYWDAVKDGQENETFETALALEPSRLEANYGTFQQTGQMLYGYFQGGCYATLLKPFLDIFSREQFLFILQDDLKTEFVATIRNLFKFLQIEENLPIQPAQNNPASLPRNQAFHNWLKKQNNVREWFKAFIPLNLRYLVKQKLLNANLRSVKYPAMKPETEAVLRTRYIDENLALSKIINRDLSAWLPR